MLAAAIAAYGLPSGVLEALRGGEAGAWEAVGSLLLYIAVPLAVGYAIVRSTDAAADG